MERQIEGSTSLEKYHGEKPKLVIVENSDALEQQARDVADARMSENMEDEPKGFFKKAMSGSFWKNTGKKIWKHNLWADVYRQKYISEAKEKIGTGDQANVFANENGNDRSAHQKANKALVDRFMVSDPGMEKDMIHRAAGEDKHILKDGGREGYIKRSLQAAIKNYARGSITEQEFLGQKAEIFATLQEARPDVINKGKLYADNLLEVAKWARGEVDRQVEQAISQEEALNRLDLNLDVVIGKAKSGVRTEAQFNAVDKIVDKIQSSWAGRWLSNDITSTAVAIAVSVAKGATKATASVAKKLGYVGGGILIGAALGGARESRKLEIERAQHARERAQGKEVARPAKAERRRELEESRLQTKDAKSLIKDLEKLLYRTGSSEVKDLSDAEIKSVFGQIAEIEARIDISDTGIRNRDISKYRIINKDKRHKVDLISYSHITKVDEERGRLDIVRATAKVKLRKLLESKGVNTFEQDLQNAVTEKSTELMGGDKGIKAQNERFTSYKQKQVAKAVLKRIVFGAAIGAVAREVKGLFDGSGLGGGFVGGPRADHGVTSLEAARKFVWNYFHEAQPSHTHATGFHEFDTTDGHHMKFANGLKLESDGRGGYNLMDNDKIVSDPASPLHMDSAGHFDTASHDYLQAHGFNPHESVATVAAPPRDMTSDELKTHFGDLAKHGRTDWHDEPGAHYSSIHHKIIEYEGKQQELFLEKSGSDVFVNANMVRQNLIENIRDRINDPDFGKSPDGTIDHQLVDLRDKLAGWISDGTLDKHIQLAVIPTDAANHAGLSELISGAASDGRIKLPPELSALFTSPENLHDGKLPFRFLELRIDGHTIATATGNGAQITGGEQVITNILDHPPIARVPEDFHILPPFPTVIDGRRPLETMRKEFVYSMYLNGETSKEQEAQFKKNRSKTLEKNPNAQLDHYKEIESYFKRQSGDYMVQLEELTENLDPMKKTCRLSIGIPVAGHQEGKNIYRSLESYSKQSVNKEEYEIILLVNHPDKRPDGSEVKPDNTLEEIARFKFDHPDINVQVMYKVLPIEDAKIWYIRKMLNDATLLRHHARGKDVQDLILLSNDADNKGISPDYIKSFINKFDDPANQHVDGFLGQLDWDPEAYVKHPAVHIGTRLFQSLAARGRRKGGGMMVSSGANFGFRSSIYAGIGGYLEPMEAGEDVNIGRAIRSARKDDLIANSLDPDMSPEEKKKVRDSLHMQFAGARSTRLYTSARRAIYAWKKGFPPEDQWNKEIGFSAFDDEVRNIDAEGEDWDYNNPEDLNKLKLEIESVIDKTLNSYIGDFSSKDDAELHNTIDKLGIKYKLDDAGRVVVTDMNNLVNGLKEYQQYAVAQRKSKSGDLLGEVEFKNIRQRHIAERQARRKLKDEIAKGIEEEAASKLEEIYKTDVLSLENLPEGIQANEITSSAHQEDLGDYDASDDVIISDKETGKVIGGIRKADQKLVIVKKMTNQQVEDANASSIRSKEVKDVEEYIKSKGINNPYLQIAEKTIHRSNELVRIYEAGVQDLDNYLLSGNTFSPKKALSLMLRVCDGVRSLHKLEIVHGDISPSNIILFKDTVKLGDLDGATVDTSGKGLFGRKGAIGNRFVMAPEMFKATGRPPQVRFGKTADVYEAGVTLFRMVAGKWPYEDWTREVRKMDSDKRMTLFGNKHESGNYEFPPAIPVDLQNVIRRAMQPNPADRYSSMDEMIIDMANAYEVV
jgi:serine/threonine protein kinase